MKKQHNPFSCSCYSFCPKTATPGCNACNSMHMIVLYAGKF